ncbi:MAG TPA: aldehyde dehydrogenase family protein, partial [Acidimicrobiales bacterium]|nr:aldehyde dehydrogenase family protein [Acidimicrobiales bacterium]
AVEGALVAKMRNGGEACTAANRFLVHDAVADEFARRLAERMAALVVGRGTEPGVDVGPLIDGPARDRVVALVEEATAGGAQVRTGGRALPGPGYFLEPTVLTDVPTVAEMTRTEIFGPVAPIQRFDDTDAAVAAANDTPYGLVSYVYTRDLDRALAVCEALEAGMVGLNRGVVSDPAAPFGGVKQSGLGREGGRAGIDEFLETTYVALPR